ncbi:hypothetical protein, partial [Streptococcus pneumoniae]|uniref:hypothetical protein n=1 Tax=Streptococcus pneumoniae TaxID=1313 RepID=UPI001E2B32E0
ISYRGFELIVGKEASIYSVNAHPAAAVADWPIVRVTGSVGLVAKKCAVMFGDSLFFLAQDGIRTISPTDGSDVPYEVSPPLSEAMQPY